MASTDRLPWRYDYWVKNPSKLIAHSEKHTLVSIHEDSTGVVFGKEYIYDERIPELCKRTASLQPDVKWSCHLLVTHHISTFDPLLPIPYSLSAVQALCSYWNVPYNYVPKFMSADTCNMSFSPVIGDEAWKGLVIDLSSNVSLVTYDSANHRTFGICLMRYAEDGERLAGRLERLPNFASSPLFASVIIAGIAVHDMTKQSSKDFSTGVDMESALGYWSSEQDKRVEQDLDFTGMIQSLNMLSIKVANAEFVCSSMISALDCLSEQLPAWPNEPSALISIELQEQARYLRQLTAAWMVALERTKGSVHSLTQTVYATLQQRDNQLSHRYGADMRLITAITLIFLPGTFVATFFSTTFWDFSPDNRGAKMSYWVYMYFAVTIGLTLLVLVVWRKFSTLKRLAAKVVPIGRRVPLLEKLMRKKQVNDEESGKKGD